MSDTVKIKEPVTKGVAKTPMIMQMESLECGAACLDMVLAYYDKWVPLEQVRVDCGVSRDGSNAGNILKAARSYNLVAEGYKLEPDELKKYGQYPCILHWNFNHFVVCNGFRGKKVSINDPAQGTIWVDMETFDQCFTGVALLFEPGEGFEPGGEPKSVLDFAKERLNGAGAAIAFVIITTLIASLTQIINTGFTQFFQDRLLTGLDTRYVKDFLLLYGGLCVLEVITLVIQSVYSLKLNGKMAVVGASEYMWKVLKLPAEFFSQRNAGDIQQRKDTNATIAENLVNILAPLALNAIMMVVYFYMMTRYSWKLTMIGLGSIVINMVVGNIISKERVNITRVQVRDQSKLYETTISGIEMIETIKASGAENGYFEKWAGYQASVNTQDVRYTRLNQILGMIPGLVTELADVLVMAGGMYLVITGRFQLGMVYAFQSYLTQFTSPANTLINSGQQLQETTTDMERIDDVMKYPEDPNYNDLPVDPEANYEKLSGHVELKNVTFGYSRLSDPLIQDFNMELKPGSRVAFVGASGCGKSTLSKLISGLYNPWSGDILFDGKHINEMDRNVFRSSLAIVDQDIILFEDTINNNLKMWDSTIQDFEVILAAHDAQIHEDIVKRDGAYNHMLIEGGKDFSGGQRQRLEIARVLAQDPTIVILDEATSALDAKTEYEVVKAIKDRGITCIIVAHRLSTIRDCDEIIVMDQGQVVERGTHDELYALGGLYTQLVTDA